MRRWRNSNNREKPKYSEKNMMQCLCFHRKSLCGVTFRRLVVTRLCEAEEVKRKSSWM
jgi:hypothetical protein